MKQKFSVFRNGSSPYDRKKTIRTGVVVGTAVLAASIAAGFAYKGEALEVYAESTEYYRQLLLSERTNEELAEDTLLGIESENKEKESNPSGLLMQMDGLPMPINVTVTQKPEQTVDLAQETASYGEAARAMEEQIAEQQAHRKATIKKAEKECISLSKRDRNVLLRIVEAEATGEDIKGRMLVANVVLNRVNYKTEFPDTVTDVVFDRTGGICQFSPIDDGRYWTVSVSEKTRIAVHRVLMGEDESDGALYFMARQYAQQDNVAWFDANLKYQFTHGAHSFFKYAR